MWPGTISNLHKLNVKNECTAWRDLACNQEKGYLLKKRFIVEQRGALNPQTLSSMFLCVCVWYLFLPCHMPEMKGLSVFCALLHTCPSGPYPNRLSPLESQEWTTLDWYPHVSGCQEWQRSITFHLEKEKSTEMTIKALNPWTTYNIDNTDMYNNSPWLSPNFKESSINC